MASDLDLPCLPLFQKRMLALLVYKLNIKNSVLAQPRARAPLVVKTVLRSIDIIHVQSIFLYYMPSVLSLAFRAKTKNEANAS